MNLTSRIIVSLLVLAGVGAGIYFMIKPRPKPTPIPLPSTKQGGPLQKFADSRVVAVYTGPDISHVKGNLNLVNADIIHGYVNSEGDTILANFAKVHSKERGKDEIVGTWLDPIKIKSSDVSSVMSIEDWKKVNKE